MKELEQGGSVEWLLNSCYVEKSRAVESFVYEHSFMYIFEGSISFFVAGATHVFNAGEAVLVKRNQLAKATKLPPPGGVFRSVSIRLDQDTLRTYSMEQGITAAGHYRGESILLLKQDIFYKSFFESLAPYLDMPLENVDNTLRTLKVKEAIILLLRQNPELKNLLFDFNEPGKIDLEEFMSRHFAFNVEMKQFAYLTGRSLATFKRDFEKVFHTSPGKWLQQRRLEQAYYLIKEKGRRPSDVYLEVGFEDLSHFSFAFKKEFGAAPTLLN
ncbi:MAG: helix-turn-helix domain-containing protein [Bacteroidetes bacterium]|nr:helix-turn-helix domain-containing protein [Bacteroidota bacterium]